MEAFTVEELKEDLEYFFETVKVREYENSAIEAATRCFYEYEATLNEGLTENIVCSLIIGKLIANSNKGIYIGQYNIVKDAIEKALDLYNELDLNEEEKKEIFLLAQELNGQLDGLTIEHDPDAK